MKEKEGRTTGVFDYDGARGALVKLGIDPHELDHIMDQANDISAVMARAMDDYVASRVLEDKCAHSESLCLALALIADKFLPVRLTAAGEKALDPVATIEAVRLIVEVEDPDDAETPAPVTVH